MQSAKEDRHHEVEPTAAKAANDPRLLPYPPKEGWWAVAMAKKARYLRSIWFMTPREPGVKTTTTHMQVKYESNNKPVL